ncbi:MAG: hypothetical protein QM695_15830 [Micropruina sp.]
MGKGKGKKKQATSFEVVDPTPTVVYWLDRAPEIRGIRRPATRMKMAAMLQRVDPARLVADVDMTDMAEVVADIDELLTVAGGDAYTDWIEQVPFADGLQVEVLLEFFNRRIFPDLGKDSSSPS